MTEQPESLTSIADSLKRIADLLERKERRDQRTPYEKQQEAEQVYARPRRP